MAADADSREVRGQLASKMLLVRTVVLVSDHGWVLALRPERCLAGAFGRTDPLHFVSVVMAVIDDRDAAHL
jgi:hypothetical protein